MGNTTSPRVRFRASAPAPPSTDAEADWLARRTGASVIGYEDWSSFGSSAQMRAASVPFGRNGAGTAGGDLETPGLTKIELNTANALTGGKCLRVTIQAGTTAGVAFAGNAGWAKDYNFPVYDYRPFYVQVVMRMNKAAIGWISTGQLGNKVFYFKHNSTGQVYASVGEGGGGFVQWNKANGSLISAHRQIAGANQYFLHTGIDNGTPAASDLRSSMRRYGVCRSGIWTDVAGGGGASAGAAAPYSMDRTGYPQADAVAGGSPVVVHDQWFVLETMIDPAPRDLYPLDGSGPGGRKPRVVCWNANYGSAPRCTEDTFCPDEREGGYGSARTTESTNQRFREWRAQHYYTDGVQEPGRPDQTIDYQQVVWSYAPIPFPGGFALPAATYGAITHYPGI